MKKTKSVPSSLQVKCVKIPVKGCSFDVTLRLVFYSDIIFIFFAKQAFLLPFKQDI